MTSACITCTSTPPQQLDHGCDNKNPHLPCYHRPKTKTKTKPINKNKTKKNTIYVAIKHNQLLQLYCYYITALYYRISQTIPIYLNIFLIMLFEILHVPFILYSFISNNLIIIFFLAISHDISNLSLYFLYLPSTSLVIKSVYNVFFFLQAFCKPLDIH